MKKPVTRFLTISFIILFLLFFSFVHSVFRLQLFKHTVSEELEEKLRVGTLKMEEEYKNIQAEAERAQGRILEGNRNRSRLVVEQIYGLMDTVEKSEGVADTPQEIAAIKETLAGYSSGTAQSFWILDAQSHVVVAPQPEQTDVNLDDGSTLADWISKKADGPISLKDARHTLENPGYAKSVKAQGWTLISFQRWDALENKIEGIESLRKIRTDNLFSKMGAYGSAGVVDGSMRLKEYTYAQLKNHSVDDIHLESGLPASKLLFNKTDGIYEYVVMDPISNRGKFRQMYVSYDEKTDCHYFITQDIRTLFDGIDRRSSPMLVYLGALTLVLLLVNVSILLWELFGRMKSRNMEG